MRAPKILREIQFVPGLGRASPPQPPPTITREPMYAGEFALQRRNQRALQSKGVCALPVIFALPVSKYTLMNNTQNDNKGLFACGLVIASCLGLAGCKQPLPDGPPPPVPTARRNRGHRAHDHHVHRQHVRLLRRGRSNPRTSPTTPQIQARRFRRATRPHQRKRLSLRRQARFRGQSNRCRHRHAAHARLLCEQGPRVDAGPICAHSCITRRRA